MINKIYAKAKKIIKENYKFALILIAVYIIFTFPLPYYVYNGGGTINLDDRISTDNSNTKLNVNMCYVNQLKGNVATYIFSHIIPHWDIEKIEDEDYDFESELYLNKIMLEESINNATINAFKVSNKDYKITGEKVLVSYIFDEANTTLEVGDQILKANNKIVHNADEYRNILDELNVGDEVKIEVMKDEKSETKEAEIIEMEGKKVTGIGVVTNYNIKTSPKIDINFKENESGPSGGLMLALGIYEKINNTSLYDGKKICGTGTIDIDGNIGEIGGVKYKLRGAVTNKCDIFLAPTDNFKEVKEEKKKNKYDIEIYEAKTYEDTIKFLSTK